MSEKLYFDTSASENMNSSAVESDPYVVNPNNVKDKYMYRNAYTREIQVGTMPINSPETIRIDPSLVTGSNTYYIIPEGYHDGTGKVEVGSLNEYTKGNATPNDVINNKIFWVNGKKLVGTLDPAQLSQEGTATSTDLIEGKTAWVNGEKITGTIPVLARRDQMLLAGDSYVFPYGLSAGTTTISAASLSSQTPGDATSDNIISGRIAWVNGEKIIGSLDINEEINNMMADTDAEQNMVLYGKKFYSSVYGMVVSGRMADHTGEPTRTIEVGQLYQIPQGYYDGSSYITTKSLYDITIGSAEESNILIGKTAWVNGEKITGTMPINDSNIIELESGSAYVIPKGYHSGTGSIVTKSVSDQTPGNATSKDIVSGKTAWVNGEKITGTMHDNSDISKELLPGETYYIPEGYHNGTGNIWSKPISEITEGTAESDNILDGYSAWVNGIKITGTMTNNGSYIVNDSLAGSKIIIPKGYHDGTGYVSVASLLSQTEANSESSDILVGKTAWVNGEKITGTLSFNGTALSSDVVKDKTFYNTDAKTIVTGTLELTGDATETDVLSGVTFYSNNPKRKKTGTLEFTGTAIEDNVLIGTTFYNTNPKSISTGSMPNNGSVTVELNAGESFIIPKGYHDGTGKVTSSDIGGQTDGTATANDIISGQTAWVNGEKITGTMPNNSNWSSENILAGQTISIPEGYHNGAGFITTETLSNQTPGNATSSDMLDGKIAWSNGTKVVGNIPTGTINVIRIAAGNDTVIPAGYYPNGITIYALYTDNILDLTGTEAYYLNEGLYPNGTGYVDEEANMLIITADIIMN